ncbi:MAG: class I SAM-dependent methyltransferase [Proteobacteria bacterium]|nr:class I SAM-dependent methyltransferase [Pseudomonadota bacterium]
MAIIETLDYPRPDAGKSAQRVAAPAPIPIHVPVKPPPRARVKIPKYLRDVYTWAYIDPVNVRLLDHNWVVNLVLWGNKDKLQRVLFDELEPGHHVLLACCVYGDLSPKLAKFIGPAGRLEVIDVSPAQIEGCRKKLRGFPQASVRAADAAQPGGGPYDDVISFFLLHEMPDDYKRAVVNALLDSVAPGGKVVFIDYHKPHPLHPLKWITALVFALLEPFAKSLWHHEIADFATDPDRFQWHKETYFGGLFQKTVARSPLTPRS